MNDRPLPGSRPARRPATTPRRAGRPLDRTDPVAVADREYFAGQDRRRGVDVLPVFDDVPDGRVAAPGTARPAPPAVQRRGQPRSDEHDGHRVRGPRVTRRPATTGPARPATSPTSTPRVEPAEQDPPGGITDTGDPATVELQDGDADGEAAASLDEDLPGRRRRWPLVLAAGLVVALLAAAGWVLYATSVFGVRTVQVAGVDDGVAADIRQAVDDVAPPGTPLLRVDLDTVRSRVEALPQVASATVTRHWPDAVVVAALARTPVAVTSANGTFWLLDSGGRPYQQVDRAPGGLVTVELATPGPQDPATTAALKIVGAMTSDFRKQVRTVRASSAYDVRVLLRDGRTVIWGGSADDATKMQVLGALLQQPGTVFDISDPTLATVR
ncbi:cell division protein FtsQ/DivIB [Nakamurella endophytica]|uniref:POTRA domain-containing protein n=1 Tax=Nakamurella endophytica TaxID=1748367 RepID=A0A917T8I1_9ACTN|nr:FtsQ-type POTRA domain-containing protein [Nakamurella endophytica]GGM11606.1 hypothetical protein GCM10011594_34400 [Nakamurella endophytica]